MRPLHLETEIIEQYLFGQTSQTADFELRMLVNNSFRERVELQKEAYRVIKTCSRAQLRTELEEIHHELEQTPYGWFKQIKNLFIGKL